MSIRSSHFFIFNNRRSDEFGIFNVNLSSGMLSEPFTANKTINEVKVRNNPIPYFINTEYEKLRFTLSFAFKDTFDTNKIRDVARWLTEPNFYAPLQFSDNLNRIFYVIFEGDSELVHNGLNQGYLELNVVCDSPYTYSPVYEQIYDYSVNSVDGTSLTIINSGDVDCYPLLYVQVLNGGTFTITNNSNAGEILSFTGISNNETLTIDCDAQDVETDMDNTYRYGNMTSNSKFIKLVRGHNYINIKGNIRIKFVMQFKTLQG